MSTRSREDLDAHRDDECAGPYCSKATLPLQQFLTAMIRVQEHLWRKSAL